MTSLRSAYSGNVRIFWKSMKIFVLIFIFALVSCTSSRIKEVGTELPPKNTIDISSLEALPGDQGYNVVIKYYIDSFNLNKYKYICSYKQLYEGKWNVITRHGDCEFESAAGTTYFDWKPGRKWERLSIIRVLKDGEYVTPPSEIFDVNPPFEIKVTLLRTPNMETCWKISKKDGEKFWGCGYSPLAETEITLTGE